MEGSIVLNLEVFISLPSKILIAKSGKKILIKLYTVMILTDTAIFIIQINQNEILYFFFHLEIGEVFLMIEKLL